MSPEAKAIYTETLEAMEEAGLANSLDRTLLRQYAELIADYLNIRKQIDSLPIEQRYTMLSANGNVVPNQVYYMLGNIVSDGVKMAKELGLTPQARSRLGWEEPEQISDEDKELLGLGDK